MKAAGAALAVFLSLAQTPGGDPLARARELYNTGRFTEAIAAAAEARQTPSLANAAAVVHARALLERYRQILDVEHLATAREALKAVDPHRLTPRDQLEYLIGLGVAVFLQGEAEKLRDRYGAAANFFEDALARADAVDDVARDKIFEWWASALDRQAQHGPDTDRVATYQKIVRRAELERARSDAAVSALFWQMAASRGAGDLERSWSAALSGWVRAGALGARGLALRADIDRFVADVLLPERAKALTANGDPRVTLAALTEQWETFKKQWTAYSGFEVRGSTLRAGSPFRVKGRFAVPR
jgi:hypothetical protein